LRYTPSDPTTGRVGETGNARGNRSTSSHRPDLPRKQTISRLSTIESTTRAEQHDGPFFYQRQQIQNILIGAYGGGGDRARLLRPPPTHDQFDCAGCLNWRCVGHIGFYVLSVFSCGTVRDFLTTGDRRVCRDSERSRKSTVVLLFSP